MIKNLCLIISISVLLSGCSLLSPVKANENTYMLTSAPQVAKSPHHHHTVLLVMPVDTQPIYNTTQMAYTNQQYKLAYFANNQWGETPPQMLQNLIIQTLQNTNHFAAVNSSISDGSYDYILNTRMLELKQIFYGNISVVRLSVRVQVVSGTTNRVVATKQFTSEVTAPQASPYGGVIAANRATSQVLAQIARFVLRTI